MINPEGETVRLFKAPEARSKRTELQVANRVEVLKVLAIALSREIQELEETQTMAGPGLVNLADEVRRFESQIIRSALIQTGGRQRRAARLLGMKVTTLNSKIKRYNINTSEMITNSAEHRYA